MRKLLTTLAAAAMVATAGAQDLDWSYMVLPEEGTLTEIREIQVLFPEIEEIDINTKDDIDLSFKGERVQEYKVALVDEQTLSITPAEPLVAAGEYVLTFPAGVIAGYDFNNGIFEDNPQDIIIKWTIEGAEGSLDFTCESSLPTTEYLAYFGEVTLTFPELESITYSGSGLSVSKNGEKIEDVTVDADANKLTLTLKEALNFVDATVEVVFAPESLSGVAGDVTAGNNEEVKLTYKMATPVEYNLELFINTPKPNDNGQISAEKSSLESFFFYCEEKGLLAAAGTNVNVTMKEVNGDFEVSGKLRKANGLNSNYSYFSVAFGKEPTYNGIYTITIDKGAFGTEVWVSDPNYGRSNDEIQINFELIDGITRDIYSIKPQTLTFGEKKDGSKRYAVATIQFEEGVEAVEGAKATLAGTDNSYRETVEFIKNEDGDYTATFEDTANGKYIFSVVKGMFGNADFIANGTGLANAPISEEVTLNFSVGVDSVMNESGAQEIYNLQGIRVNSSIDTLPAGIYIIGGKKISIVK